MSSQCMSRFDVWPNDLRISFKFNIFNNKKSFIEFLHLVSICDQNICDLRIIESNEWNHSTPVWIRPFCGIIFWIQTHASNKVFVFFCELHLKCISLSFRVLKRHMRDISLRALAQTLAQTIS